jgi:hypothetical protein
MRNFAVFLSFYLLVLTLLPCGDAFAHEDSSLSVEIVEQTTSEHTDVCSSLCSCACCGQITYHETALLFSFDTQANFKETLQHYKEKVTRNFSGFIWQPPKIINLLS